MTTGTRLVVLLLLVGTFYVEAEDVTCGNDRKTKEKITIKDGDNFSFKTQAGAEYGGNVKCTVTYKRHKSCPAMKFSCESFALSSTKATCKKGDKMTVKADGANQKYCMNNSPNVTTTGKTIKVTFTSNMNTHGDGAVCSVQCLADATTATTPSTPTPTIPTTTEGNLCPTERPDFGTLCQHIPANISCEYGQQECCGETYADIKMECMEGTWQGIAVETPCLALGGQPCPTTLSPNTCPVARPDFGTPCQTVQSGLYCEYGTQECCGEISPTVIMECDGDNWQGYFVDTVCVLGLPCPSPPTTARTTQPMTVR